MQLRTARLAFDVRSSSIMVVTDPETWGRKHEMLWPQACWIKGLSSPLGPISFIFMQFLAKSCQKTGFLPQTQGLAPSVWEILDPPLTAVFSCLFLNCHCTKYGHFLLMDSTTDIQQNCYKIGY